MEMALPEPISNNQHHQSAVGLLQTKVPHGDIGVQRPKVEAALFLVSRVNHFGRFEVYNLFARGLKKISAFTHRLEDEE